MKQDIITTALYYRKPTNEEIASGTPKRRRFFIKVPVKDVFLGVTDQCGAVLSRSIIGPDGLRYYFECVNLIEHMM